MSSPIFIHNNNGIVHPIIFGLGTFFCLKTLSKISTSHEVLFKSQSKTCFARDEILNLETVTCVALLHLIRINAVAFDLSSLAEI